MICWKGEVELTQPDHFTPFILEKLGLIDGREQKATSNKLWDSYEGTPGDHVVNKEYAFRRCWWTVYFMKLS